MLERVRERWKLDPVAACVLERLGEQPVCEPRVAREQRPVEVGAVDPAGTGALEPRASVVAEARDDPAERRCLRIQERAAAVILEARELLAGPLAVDEDVPDHPPLAGDRLERQQADPRQLGTRAVAVGAAEELVAAADGEEDGAVLGRLGERRALRGEVRRDELLLPILAPADVEEVRLCQRGGVAHPDREDDELVAPHACPDVEHGDVPAVGVDVELIGVEVADRDPHCRGSQNAGTSPRRAATARRASIAV